jgi:uncharacterized protein (TIGR03435 family)
MRGSELASVRRCPSPMTVLAGFAQVVFWGLPLLAQTAAPVFEVVSIKPAVLDEPGAAPHLMGMRRTPVRIDIGRWSVKQLVLRAYGLWPSQLSGPEWMDTARFDVSATLPPGARPEQLPEMLQHMLADRFGLKIHRATKTMLVFSLIVGKGGAKMQRGPDDDPSALLPAGQTQAARVERMGRMLDRIWGMGEDLGLRMLPAADGNLRVEFTKMPMAALTQFLAAYLRSPVFDDTGLTGNYQAVLEFSVPRIEGDDVSADALLSAVSRLGLRLERRKAPVESVVVDSLLRTPSSN